MEERQYRSSRNRSTPANNTQQQQVFRVDLTPEEQKALSLLLPKGCIFQADTRKKEKPQSKKKIPEETVLELPEPPTKNKVVQSQSKKGAQKQAIIQAMKPCVKLLEQLKQHKCAWPFLQPVDVQGLNIPQYRQIVKEPMDFSTVEANLKAGVYQQPQHFHNDIAKIFRNSYLFNASYEEFIKITHELQKYYYRISGQSKPQQEKQVIPKALPPSKPQKKKKKPPQGAREGADSQPVTTEEKRELAFHINRLAKEHLRGVRNIVFENGSQENQFDLEKLSQKKLKELQRYIRGKISEMEQNLRASLMEKSEQQNLDELESEVTERFIDESEQMEIQ